MRLTVTVYGASDDLAEIEGDFYDEFDADCYNTGIWQFSNGTRISMAMNKAGDWVLGDVTPADVVNDNEISFGRRPGHPDDMTCTVTGNFDDVQWFKSGTVSAKRAIRQ